MGETRLTGTLLSVVDSVTTDANSAPVMRTLLVVFVAGLCLSQLMDARHIRDTSAQTTWEDLMNLGVESWNNMTRVIESHINKDQIKTQLQTSAQELATKVQQVVEEMKAQAPLLASNASALVSQAATQLEQRAQNIRQDFPDAAQGVDSLKTQMDSMMNELREVHTSLQPHGESVVNSFKQLTQEMVGQATTMAQNIQQEIQRVTANN